MVRAILDGTKSQTRRPYKNRKHPDFGCDMAASELVREAQHVIDRSCPYGQPGDRLWVRETWARDDHDGMVMFRADVGKGGDADDWQFGINEGAPGYRWRPSIHMPRWASRISLEITTIRVEQLQDISESDAQSEGVCGVDWGHGMDYGGSACYTKPYRALWESINGDGSWEVNPWVWVVEFKRVP